MEEGALGEEKTAEETLRGVTQHMKYHQCKHCGGLEFRVLLDDESEGDGRTTLECTVCNEQEELY